MTLTAIRITNLSPKVTDHILRANFSTIGPVLKIDLFDDSTGNKCADVAFESEKEALEAIKEFNGKEIIKKAVKIELVKESEEAKTEEVVLDKERIGELVFPVAQKLHSKQAAKLTGMLVESVLSLKTTKSDADILNILQSENLISELVEAAHKKLTQL